MVKNLRANRQWAEIRGLALPIAQAARPAVAAGWVGRARRVACCANDRGNSGVIDRYGGIAVGEAQRMLRVMQWPTRMLLSLRQSGTLVFFSGRVFALRANNRPEKRMTFLAAAG